MPGTSTYFWRFLIVRTRNRATLYFHTRTIFPSLNAFGEPQAIPTHRYTRLWSWTPQRRQLTPSPTMPTKEPRS